MPDPTTMDVEQGHLRIAPGSPVQSLPPTMTLDAEQGDQQSGAPAPVPSAPVPSVPPAPPQFQAVTTPQPQAAPTLVVRPGVGIPLVAPRDDQLQAREQHAREALQNLYIANASDPEKRARDLALADSLQLPSDVTRLAPDEVQRAARMNGIDLVWLRRQPTTLLGWLGDGDNAAIAGDDLRTLGGLTTNANQLSDLLASRQGMLVRQSDLAGRHLAPWEIARMHSHEIQDFRPDLPWLSGVVGRYARKGVADGANLLLVLPALAEFGVRKAIGASVGSDVSRWSTLGALYESQDNIRREDEATELFRESGLQKSVGGVIETVANPLNALPAGAATSVGRAAAMKLSTEVATSVARLTGTAAVGGVQTFGQTLVDTQLDTQRQRTADEPGLILPSWQAAANSVAQGVLAYFGGRIAGLRSALRLPPQSAPPLLQRVGEKALDTLDQGVVGGAQAGLGAQIEAATYGQKQPDLSTLAEKIATGAGNAVAQTVATDGAMHAAETMPQALSEVYRTGQRIATTIDAAQAAAQAAAVTGHIITALDDSQAYRRNAPRVTALLDLALGGPDQWLYLHHEDLPALAHAAGVEPEVMAQRLRVTPQAYAEAQTTGALLPVAPSAACTSVTGSVAAKGELVERVRTAPDALNLRQARGLVDSLPGQVADLAAAHGQQVESAAAEGEAVARPASEHTESAASDHPPAAFSAGQHGAAGDAAAPHPATPAAARVAEETAVAHAALNEHAQFSDPRQAQAAGLDAEQSAAYHATVEHARSVASAAIADEQRRAAVGEQQLVASEPYRAAAAHAAAAIDARPDVQAAELLRVAHTGEASPPHGEADPHPTGLPRGQGLDRAAVQRLAAASGDHELPARLAAKGMLAPAGRPGLDPQVVAAVAGFDSADGLLRAVVAAPERGQLIHDQAVAAVTRTHPALVAPLLTGGAAPAVAGARGAVLHHELNILAQRSGKSAPPLPVLRATARENIAGKPLRAIDPRLHQAAEREARQGARTALVGHGGGSGSKQAADTARRPATAFGEKQRELLNHELARAGAQALASAQALRVQLSGFTTPEARVRLATRGGTEWRVLRPDGSELGRTPHADHAAEAARAVPGSRVERFSPHGEQIDGILLRAGLLAAPLGVPQERAAAPSHNGLADRVAPSLAKPLLAGPPSLDQWCAAQRARGLPANLPADLPASVRSASAAPGRSVPRSTRGRPADWRDLTLDQLRAVHDAVVLIDHLAQLQHELLAAPDGLGFGAARAALHERLAAGTAEQHAALARLAGEVSGKAGQPAVDGLPASVERLPELLALLDGAPHGPWRERFIEPFIRAAHEEARLQQAASAHLEAAFARWEAAGGRSRSDDAASRRLLPGPGRALTRLERVMVALHAGTTPGRQRLRAGHGWSDDQLAVVLATLDYADARLVVDLAGVVAAQHATIATQQERLTGTRPRAVVGAPLLLAGELHPGWYFPPVVERAAPRPAVPAPVAGLAGIAAAVRGAAYSAATTARGHAQACAAAAGHALSLDCGVIGRHLQRVIHDLTHHQALGDAARLLADPLVADPLLAKALNTHGGAVRSVLHGTLDRLAGAPLRDVAGIAGALSRRAANVGRATLGTQVWERIRPALPSAEALARIGREELLRALLPLVGDRARCERLRRLVAGLRSATREPAPAQPATLVARVREVIGLAAWQAVHDRACAAGHTAPAAIREADGAVAELLREPAGGAAAEQHDPALLAQLAASCAPRREAASTPAVRRTDDEAGGIAADYVVHEVGPAALAMELLHATASHPAAPDVVHGPAPVHDGIGATAATLLLSSARDVALPPHAGGERAVGPAAAEPNQQSHDAPAGAITHAAGGSGGEPPRGGRSADEQSSDGPAPSAGGSAPGGQPPDAGQPPDDDGPDDDEEDPTVGVQVHRLRDLPEFANWLAAANGGRSASPEEIATGMERAWFSGAGHHYVLDDQDRTVYAEGRITGRHKNRGKGNRPDPVGGVPPGDQRGHLIPENGVDDRRDVNRRENFISEGRHSNLSQKRMFENDMIALADQHPDSVVRSRHIPVYEGNELRPHMVIHVVLQDGKVVRTVPIKNLVEAIPGSAKETQILKDREQRARRKQKQQQAKSEKTPDLGQEPPQ